MLQEIHGYVLKGKADLAEEKVKAALEAGHGAEEILNTSLVPAMDEVGQLFEDGELFVPEMLISARAMNAALGVLKPLLVEADVQPAGKVVIGTVKGDLHDIGKNLVAMMLEGAGFEVIDLGTDVGPEQFAQAVRENNADIIGMSALLTTTMPIMASTVEAIEDLGIRDNVKVLIGGAPVTDAYAKEIGADSYGADASMAVKISRELCG